MTTRKHPHEPHESEPEEPATAMLESRLAELESALAEAKDRHLRLAADFDNYKKRMRQEQLETIQHASAELINRLLPGRRSPPSIRRTQSSRSCGAVTGFAIASSGPRSSRSRARHKIKLISS